MTLNLAVPSPLETIVAEGAVVNPTPGFKSSSEPIEPDSVLSSFGLIIALLPGNPGKAS